MIPCFLHIPLKNNSTRNEWLEVFKWVPFPKMKMLFNSRNSAIIIIYITIQVCFHVSKDPLLCKRNGYSKGLFHIKWLTMNRNIKYYLIKITDFISWLEVRKLFKPQIIASWLLNPIMNIKKNSIWKRLSEYQHTEALKLHILSTWAWNWVPGIIKQQNVQHSRSRVSQMLVINLRHLG